MKRCWGKVLEVLEEAEALKAGQVGNLIKLPNPKESHDQEKGYAAKLLWDADFICAESAGDGINTGLKLKGLTWAGHDLLDRLRGNRTS